MKKSYLVLYSLMLAVTQCSELGREYQTEVNNYDRKFAAFSTPMHGSQLCSYTHIMSSRHNQRNVSIAEIRSRIST